MNGEERRNSILEELGKASSPINATKLANKYSVTRQIIVADIALLRAYGHPISAKNRGYLLEGKADGLRKIIAVKHGKNDVTDEFYAVIDNGGKIIDVIVEHPVYGKISAELNISSRYEADEFVKKMSLSDVNPLSLLTEGLHLHTIDAKDEETYERIINKLSELGILIETE